MENYFYTELNHNAVEALKRDAAFFMKPNDAHILPINNSFAGTPISGANYFNFKLFNDLHGTNHTEYVKVNEVLSSNMDWLSALRESRSKGVVYQEEGSDNSPRYAFMMPTADLKKEIFRDNAHTDMRHADMRQTDMQYNYVPFQSNNVPMDDFANFVQEQCANAINASLSGCAFKNNIPEHELDQFKAQLISEITKNPGFMAAVADKAQQEVNEFHRLSFDRNSFIEKARNEDSNEFKQLNSAIADHVNDMCQNKRKSFNPEFEELSRPLVINIGNIYIGSAHQGQDPKPAVEKEITEFVREKIHQERPAEVLADTFLGTFVEKTKKLVQENPRVSAGLALACSIINPILARKFEVDDFIKIADNIAALQKLKGDKTLENSHDRQDTRSFNADIEKAIRDNPHVVEKAMVQLGGGNEQYKAHSAGRGR